MFLKRSLVVVVGILLFIGVLLLKLHLTQTNLENEFKADREKYGVEGTVLTLPQSAMPQPPENSTAPAPTPAPDVATEPIVIAPDSTPSAAASTPSSGNGDEPSVNIGPDSSSAPDSSTPPPSSSPADTNGAPMAPQPSTMNFHRNRSSFLVETAYRPSETVFTLASGRWTQTNQVPSPASTNSTPPVTNADEAAKPSEDKPASPATTGIKPATTAAKIAGHAVSVGGRAIVLGYHQFTGPGIPSKNPYSMSQDVFESEMKYLHDNGYNVVPLSDVVRFVKHEIGLPPNAVAITIDDGYKSALNYAAPVLKQYGYPWTYFVYPAFITKTESKGAASWPDLLELDKEGVDVESHSMTHPQLTKKTQKFHGARHLLSPEEYDQFLTEETAGAKAVLEQHLGKKIKYFAYPYGDYNKQVEAKAIAAGYEAIFTVADNPVHITTDIYAIGRYIITKPVEHAFAAYLKQGALSLAQVDPAPGATTSNPLPVITAVLGFNGDPASLETEVRDYGIVRHDFDPETSTVRLYLPRPLISSPVFVNIRAKDDQSGQTMVANWHFNYEPSGDLAAPAHEPIANEPTPSTTEGAGEGSEHNAEPAKTATSTNLAPAVHPAAGG
jgi:peptidoglycan/xylan/chitin deacetylase (PgdA/CDA1 family)